MNFKVGDVLCHREKSFIFKIFDSTMPFLKIKYEIKSIDKPPLTDSPEDSNLNEDQKQNSYKIHVTVTGCDKLTKEKRKELSDDYFPQENLDLTQPEIKTFLYYYVTQDHGEFYKKYTEEQIKIKEIPSWKSAINFFDLIKCSDTVKIDGKFVIDGHDGRSVIKIISKTEEISDGSLSSQGSYFNNSNTEVPKTYIITYGDGEMKEMKEITLYGPDKNNNYTTSLPNPPLPNHPQSLLRRCANRVCNFLGIGGAKTKHHKKRKGRSKTRKRQKSKRHINKLNKLN